MREVIVDEIIKIPYKMCGIVKIKSLSIFNTRNSMLTDI